MHSVVGLSEDGCIHAKFFTFAKAPPFDPPRTYRTERRTARNWLRTDLGAQLWASAGLEESLVPLTSENIHQIHPARI